MLVNGNSITNKKELLNKQDMSQIITNNNLLEIPKSKFNNKQNYNFNFENTSMNNINYNTTRNNIISQNDNNNYHEKNNQAESIKNNRNKLLYIPCMNCGNEIPVNETKKHSLICLTVNSDIINKENNGKEFEFINYKLNKINTHLNNIYLGKLDMVTDNLKKEVSIYGRELYKYISESINVEEVTLNNIKYLKILCSNCENLQRKYGKLSLSSSIIIDRVKVLINEKILKIKTILRRNALIRKDMNQKKYETNINLIKYNFDSETESNNINNNYNKNNKIEEIQSDIENQTTNQLNNTLTSLNSSVSSQSFYNVKTDLRKKVSEELSNIFINNHLNNDNKNLNIRNSFGSYKPNENNDKKEFMKRVFRYKFECLHSSHIGQHINPKDIYEEAKRLKIAKPDWDNFIMNELNNPYKYAKKIMKNNRNVSINKVFERVNKERLMDIINEE